MKFGKIHMRYNVPIMPQNAPNQTFLPQMCPINRPSAAYNFYTFCLLLI